MKLKMKIAVLFALLFASMSWGWGGINQLDVRVCGIASDAINSFESQSWRVATYDGRITEHHEQDILEGGKNTPHVYLGYKETPYINHLESDPQSFNYELPITNIIIRNLGTGYTGEETFDTLGATYHRLQIHDAYGRNFDADAWGNNYKWGDITNNTYTPRLYIYYTRERFDDKRVFDIRIIRGAVTQYNYATGFERINVNLGAAVGQETYMYIYRRAYSADMINDSYTTHPEAKNNPNEWRTTHLTFNGKPQALLTPGSYSGSDVLREEYKIGENGTWSTSIPTATNTGDYTLYSKLVSKDARYVDYVYGPMTAKIYQATSSFGQASGTIKNQNGATSNFYSKDRIYVYNWVDSCGSRSAKFYVGGYQFTRTNGIVLSSGTYSVTVELPENANCPEKTVVLASNFKVKKSKMIFDPNGGTMSVTSIEGETGSSYTKPKDPTRTGYTFNRWSSELPSAIPRGENKYIAQWTAIQYTMTFNANGGTFSDGKTTKTITQDYNTTVAKPANPTRTDYVFTGWNQSVPTLMPAQNMTFIAQWKYNRFKVDLFDQWEVVQGEAAEDGTYANGSTVKFRLKPGYVLWSNVTYDGQKVTPDENGVYTITVVDHDAKVWTTIAQVFGAIQVDVNGNQGVIIDGNSNETSEVPEEIEFTGGIKILRDFERYNATTVVLPFTMPLKYVWGGIFCKFLGMSKSGFNYTVRLMFVNTEIKANEPYVFVPLDNRIVVDFRDGHSIIVGGKFKLKTEEKSVTYGDWSFNSLYHKKEWNGGVSEGDANGQVSYYFKSSGQKVDGVSGSFVKMTDGSVGPMQAYISYNGNKPQAVNRSPSMAGKSAPSFSIADLPDEINIELVDESEKTVGLGKINMSTGKVKLDCWFDMKGNLLKGKPTAKGIYFYNGQQVIVK